MITYWNVCQLPILLSGPPGNDDSPASQRAENGETENDTIPNLGTNGVWFKAEILQKNICKIRIEV